MNTPFFLLTFLAFFFWNTTPPPFYSTDLNRNLEGALVQDIYGAKKSIFLSSYNVSSQKIIQALRSSAARGILTEVLVDRNASFDAVAKLGKDVRTLSLDGKGLMHHKILIIDQKDVWLGSANMTRESLRTHSNFMQKVSSPALALWIEDKLTSMKVNGLKRRFPHKIFSINNQTLEFWFLPDDPGGSLRIKELIRSAKKTIKVAMYTFTRMDFADTLIRAAQRGVDVQVVMDRNMCDGACKRVVDLLTHSQVKLFISEGKALLHNKMMVVDDQILEHGSANWTKAAFTQNEDYFIVLYDLTADQKKELGDLWQALLKRSSSI